jgi:hypothetical protein
MLPNRVPIPSWVRLERSKERPPLFINRVCNDPFWVFGNGSLFGSEQGCKKPRCVLRKITECCNFEYPQKHILVIVVAIFSRN